MKFLLFLVSLLFESFAFGRKLQIGVQIGGQAHEALQGKHESNASKINDILSHLSPEVKEIYLASISVKPGNQLETIASAFGDEIGSTISKYSKSRDFYLVIGKEGDEEGRKFHEVKDKDAFVNEVVKVLNLFQLRGVILNWDTPKKRPDWYNYASLCIALGERLKKENYKFGVSLHPGMEKILLTVGVNYLEARRNKWVDAVDFILLKTFINVCPSISNDVGECKLAPLDYVARSVASVKDYSIPSHKIIVGLPVYFRHTSGEIGYDYDIKSKGEDMKHWSGDGIHSLQDKLRTVVRDMRLGGFYFYGVGSVKDVEPPTSVLNTALTVMKTIVFGASEDEKQEDIKMKDEL